MDNKVAYFLITSLMERAERGQIGVVSTAELDALRCALTFLDPAAAPPPPYVAPMIADNSASTSSSSLPASPPSSLGKASNTLPLLPDVDLVTDATQRTEPSDWDVLMCLDFGTAMSKAWATREGQQIELALGKQAGQEGFAVPSSVFISDDGCAYFGQEAIDRSENLVEAGRSRLDSLKSWLSLRREGDLDAEASVLEKHMNPTDVRLTEGDMIRLYLAYLTDLACGALQGKFAEDKRHAGRYVVRRYARPCWTTEQQTEWADRLMRTLLAEAQILADTFRGKWLGGIPVKTLKRAIDKVKILPDKPEYLIDSSIPEPVAVAAGVVGTTDNLRDAYMVVDAGAGTTDFGLFVFTPGKNFDEPKLYQLRESIHGVNQAGDKMDHLLRAYIIQTEGVDPKDVTGRLIEADLRLKIRSIKETLFKEGQVQYALRDGTIGTVVLQEFLVTPTVKKFRESIETEFKKALSNIDKSWLQWLAKPQVKLNVVLTGGSSNLPMIKELTQGVVDCGEYKILRCQADPRPEWIKEAAPALQAIYPQLAVAIGGVADEMPETYFGPVSIGGEAHPTYVASNVALSGA